MGGPFALEDRRDADLRIKEDSEGFGPRSPLGDEEEEVMVEAEEVLELNMKEGTWIVSMSRDGNGRTLHKLAVCYRKPGIHYKRCQEVEMQEVLDRPAETFTKVCGDCLRKDKGILGRAVPESLDTEGSSSDSSSS